MNEAGRISAGKKGTKEKEEPKRERERRGDRALGKTQDEEEDEEKRKHGLHRWIGYVRGKSEVVNLLCSQ